MRKAIIFILSLLVIGGGAIYGTRMNSHDAAIYAARHEYSEALDQATETEVTTYHHALLVLRDERDIADEVWSVDLDNAKKAHDQALAKVANLTANDPVRLKATRKADEEQRMAEDAAAAKHRLTTDAIGANFKKVMTDSEAANVRALAEADRKYDEATKNLK
jgi:hypothetical protein